MKNCPQSLTIFLYVAGNAYIKWNSLPTAMSRLFHLMLPTVGYGTLSTLASITLCIEVETFEKKSYPVNDSTWSTLTR